MLKEYGMRQEKMVATMRVSAKQDMYKTNKGVTPLERMIKASNTDR